MNKHYICSLDLDQLNQLKTTVEIEFSWEKFEIVFSEADNQFELVNVSANKTADEEISEFIASRLDNGLL